MSQPDQTDTKKSVSWFKKFQYDKNRDSPGDTRNVLLIVVALIAAVTFQAGVNPSGGVWQEGDRLGRAIYSSQKHAFYVFRYLSHILARAKMSPPTTADTKRSASWFKKFQYDEDKDKPGEARNVLLVVVALIAAVTFQAGVNPPGGVWQEGDHAGRAIYSSQKFAFYVFLISNTLALSTCILVITSLTYRFPFHFEIWVATASMMTTYASAIFAVTPNETVRFRYLLITASGPFVMRCLFYIFKKYRVGKNESQT